MIINPVLESRIVDRYEFAFTDGFSDSITVDTAAGDTIDWDANDLSVTFHIAPKPSPVDPDQKYAAFTKTIFLRHVLSITRTELELTPPSPEQRDYFKTVLLKAPATLQ